MGLLQHAVAVVVVVCLLTTSSEADNDLGGLLRHKRRVEAEVTSPEVCKMTPSAEVNKLLHSSTDPHHTFYQYPPLLHSVTTLEEFRRENARMVDIQYSYLDSGSSSAESCPSHPPRAVGWDPCPRRWKFNRDPNRLPETMAEVECLGACPYCQQTSPADFTMGCASIPYHVRVFRRLPSCDSSGHYRYAEVWEPVTVGCACRSGVNLRQGREAEDTVKSG